MAGLCSFTPFLLRCFAALLLASQASLNRAVPQSQRAAGVLMLLEGGRYTFNFSAASAACLYLNVTMATRAQMERALNNGLETCKFGWIAERIAVVPRLKPDSNCGKGKTGVVEWAAQADRKFGAFCFNASDLEQSQKTTTAAPQSSTSSTSLMALTRASTPATPTVGSTPAPPPSTEKLKTTKPTEQSHSTAAFTLPVKTASSARISPSASPSIKPFSTHIPSSLPHIITSKATSVSFAFFTSVQVFNFSGSSGSVPPQPQNSAKRPLGDVYTALIILGIIVVLLAAAGAVWYYKLNMFRSWPKRQLMDDIQTEMWMHTDCEDSQHGAEEEEDDENESYRKYSSEITLCVNPNINANSV
ncbi:lymphatic vessel endothelial hyaluronic receptor 1b [Mugil cephalus]|uniref:lymphatic vessel endothelial hyaluronic receptor 1b n=1 Tax=Mugil cephalus TaxID=48193 RepID=UPI001FB598CA|nr:lymphatic vessel endothelial hyaluronic receptor 1b [Mugil cephalus]